MQNRVQNSKLSKIFPANKRCYASSGFTLIELLTVMAIISLFAALLLPRLDVPARWILRAAAHNLMCDLRLLRQEAITSGEECLVKFYIDTNCYQLILPENSQQLIYLPGGIYFEGSTTFGGNPPTAAFNNLGHPCRSGGGTVILKSEKGDKLYVIVLPVTGRVKVSRDPPAN